MPHVYHQSFRKNLNISHVLIIFGYGFGDSYINSLIREWMLSENKRFVFFFTHSETYSDLDLIGSNINEVIPIEKNNVVLFKKSRKAIDGEFRFEIKEDSSEISSNLNIIVVVENLNNIWEILKELQI